MAKHMKWPRHRLPTILVAAYTVALNALLSFAQDGLFPAGGSVSAVLGNDSGTPTATLTFAPSAMSRRLFMACDDDDRGDATNGWAVVTALADVPANATTATVPFVPTHAKMRFFLEAIPDASSYAATNSLVLHYDCAASGGLVVNNDAATAWRNLGVGGAAYDLTLPDWVTQEEGGALFSEARTSKSGFPSFSSVDGLSRGSNTTIEATMQNAGWRYTDNKNQIQTVMSAPIGAVGFRNDTNVYFLYPKTSSKNNVRQPSANPYGNSPITLSSVTSLGNVSAYINGEFITTSDGTQLDPAANFDFFTNPRADVRAWSIRVYSCKLSAAEVEHNAKVDAVRFLGANDCFLCASEALDASGAMLVTSTGVVNGVRRVNVQVIPSAFLRRLYFAFGQEDGGETTNGWSHVVAVAQIPRNAASVADVALPRASRNFQHGRYFMTFEYTSADYISDGLVMQYDGLDNSIVDGVRTHLAAPATWADLSGNGHDVTLPANNLVVEADAMLSRAALSKTTPTVTVDGISSATKDSPITVEQTSSRGSVSTGDGNGSGNKLQHSLSTPLGHVGYRKTVDNGFVLVYPNTSEKCNIWNCQPNGKSALERHTIAATLGYDAGGRDVKNSMWMDGEYLGAIGNDGAYALDYQENFVFFANSHTDIRTCSIRVYGRKLNAEEIAYNSMIDGYRFRGNETAWSCTGVVDCYTPSGFTLIFR